MLVKGPREALKQVLHILPAFETTDDVTAVNTTIFSFQHYKVTSEIKEFIPQIWIKNSFGENLVLETPVIENQWKVLYLRRYW